LDGYTIQHGLGRGGFGEVYFAISDSGRHVALKAVQNYEDIELRGITHCMNLKNAHLVTIFDVRHNDEGDPFVIMEYVDGPSLRDLLDAAEGGLGEAKAVFFLREIAKGLTYLHDCGVVHRDLKPHNVFYEEGVVKIGDYSLSKTISTSHRSGHTVTVGTVHYMAPEISLGKYDHTVDIYALGVIFYEMLVGHPPFVGETMAEVLLRHLSAEVDLSLVPPKFHSVLRKALAKDPQDRYRSAQEMSEAVFGVETVQDSVSALAIDGLSVVAKQVAKNLATHASPPVAGRGPELFPQQSASAPPQLAATHAWHSPEATRKTDKSDPIAHSRRLVLAGVGAFAICALTAIVAPWQPLQSNDSLVLYACVTAAASLGIWLTNARLKVERPAFYFSRKASILIGAGGALGAFLATLVFEGVWEHLNHEGEMLTMSFVSLIILDWRAVLSPSRDQRLALTPILVGATIGGIASALMGVFPIVGAGLIAAVVLTVQMASPWNNQWGSKPDVARNWQERARHAYSTWLRGESFNSPNHRFVATVEAAKQHVDKELGKFAPQLKSARPDDALTSSISPHSRVVALVLACIMPFPGLHRFYVGKYGTGILWLLTGGLAAIGQIIDLVMIACGVFRDSQQRLLVAWRPDEVQQIRALNSEKVNGYSSVPREKRLSLYWKPSAGLRFASLLAAFVGTAFVAINALVPAATVMLQYGVFDFSDPQLSNDLRVFFGDANWASTVNGLIQIVCLFILVICAAILVFARHNAGALHIGRAVIASVLIIAASFGIGAMASTNFPWPHVGSLTLESQWIVIVRQILAERGTIVMLAIWAGVGCAGVFLFAWPKRNEIVAESPVTTTAAPQLAEKY
jgi:serine/threonine protein kinase